MRIYLAGPLVFDPDWKRKSEILKDKCAARGAFGLFPLDAAIESAETGVETAERIYEANIAMIDMSDAVIADLTPFRGPSADVGTGFEVGYAVGARKIVAGYSSDERHYVDRAIPFNEPGWAVEHFGLRENLMVEIPLRLAGGTLRSTFEEALEDVMQRHHKIEANATQ